MRKLLLVILLAYGAAFASFYPRTHTNEDEFFQPVVQE